MTSKNMKEGSAKLKESLEFYSHCHQLGFKLYS